MHVDGATTGPVPQLPGTIDSCKTYHLVQSGNTCFSIYTALGITFEQFRVWNTGINDNCSNLWLGYYICIGV